MSTKNRRTALESVLDDVLADRGAAAFVHVGSVQDPTVEYCRLSIAGGERAVHADTDDGIAADEVDEGDADVLAVGYIADADTEVADADAEWLVHTASAADGTHPAARLADDLEDRGLSGTVLTPPTIPHDAALYLENAGASLASTDVISRARATKTAMERDRIAAAQAAASAGIRRGGAVLADATAEDGRLVVDGEPLTSERLRIAIDEAVVAAGGFPAGGTVVSSPAEDGGADSEIDNATDSDALHPGEPIVLAVAPRGPDDYRGRLVRTLVVDSEGGRERRAHVAVTQAFRSARAMVTADTASVTAIEADLKAEIRAFGEDGAIETTVAGVGLEPAERPLAGSEDVAPGTVVRLDAAVDLEDGGGQIRLSDVLEKRDDGVSWLGAPSRSIDPATVGEE